MFQLSAEVCEAFVDELLAVERPDQLRMIFEMGRIAVAEDVPGYPIIVSHVFRGRRLYDWAEYVLQLASRIPAARPVALSELALVEQLRGRNERSVQWLRQLDTEVPLDGDQHRRLAHQLAHTGEFDAARAHLERALVLEPESMELCLALRQYVDYVARYPMEEALGRAKALARTYRTKDTAEIADEITGALKEQRPYSMVRVNDGEGAFLYLSLDDEADYSALYRRNRTDWHHIIFGGPDLLFDRDFIQVTRRFTDGLKDADAIGAEHHFSLAGEYAWGSLRNVPCLFNIVRKLEHMARAGEVDPQALTLCNPQINQHLLFDGHLERLIGSQRRIGLISAHPALPAALKERFGLDDVIYHRTPGEALVHSGLEKEPIASWHGRITRELAEVVEPGMLYLCCAGLFSKLYCQMVKDAGGVGLDIGAVADIWVKAQTRGHHSRPEVQAYGLIDA